MPEFTTPQPHSAQLSTHRLLVPLALGATLLAGCVRSHESTGFALAQLDATDHAATSRPPGFDAIGPGHRDAPSIAGLARSQWGIQRETFPLGQVDTDPTYAVNQTLTDSQARQLGEFPSPDTAVQTPNDDDRLMSAAEGFTAPALALADGVLLIPRFLMKPPVISNQWSGLQTGKFPQPQTGVVPIGLGIQVQETARTVTLPAAGEGAGK
ncbi:MAG: hypothetical protein K2X32_00455 [Phycisphaerales bacterium]|nr:hypothetical protein [Phycisphaerales bacterium]